MNKDYRKRIVHDYKEIKDMSDVEKDFYIQINENDITQWKCVVFGAQGSDHENGIFILSIKFTEEYPNEPPSVEFLGNVFHPNVYNSGKICLDLLQNTWSSSYTVRSLLLAIVTLLNDPNTDSPANLEAAKLFTENKMEYKNEVHKCVISSWKNPEILEIIREGLNK